MRRPLLLGIAAVSLVAAKAPFPLAPADDPVKPIGAADRAKNGPSPLARPGNDIGMAEDPPGTTRVPEAVLPDALKDKPQPKAAERR